MIRRKQFHTILKAYDTTDPLELKRLIYVVWIELGLLFMFCTLTVIHLAFSMHVVHYIGDLGGVCAVLFSLYFLRSGRQMLSGSVIIWSLSVIIFVYGVLVDYVAKGNVEFLRLYVTLFSEMGVFILIISVFKAFRGFIQIAIIFSLITIIHAATIIYHNGGWQTMTSEMLSYFFVGILTINVAGFVTHLTSQFNRELMKQNKGNLDKISQHNINLNELVERQTAELRESNERLESFAHIASHDLKEPLRSISGFVTLIGKHIHSHYPGDHAIDEYMGFVTSGTQRMGSLINDILAFSKLHSGKNDFESLDLNDTISRVKIQLSTIINSKNAIIQYHNLPMIHGQPNLILEVFLNLMSNGIRYSKPGSQPIIEISSIKKKDTVEVIVKDNGIGISAELMQDIFMPYYSRNKNASEESTGMGLAICKKIIEFHGGTIWAESIENEGSAFHCVFPI